MAVSVIGLGRLGAPLAAILADSGHQVIGVDRDPAVVAGLRDNTGALEPGLQELLASAAPNLTLTTSTADAVRASESTFILVPTPSVAAGDYSNRFVLDALEQVGAAIAGKPGRHLVTIVSTVMPGTMEGVIRPALERASGRSLGEALGLCYCPEFVALGAVIAGMRAPDLVLIGQSDAAAGDQLVSILQPSWNNAPAVWQLNFVDAELSKIAVNGFVTTKISYANMLAELCDALPGADAAKVTAVLGSDRRIGPAYLAPGLGYAGPCFPRDNAAIAAIAHRAGVVADIAEATDAINDRQAQRIVTLLRHQGEFATVGVLGLAYKPDSDLVVASQGLQIAALLAEAGHEVIVHDPVARPPLPPGVTLAANAAECVGRCDAIVIATPWPDYAALDWSALTANGPVRAIVDCWRMPALGAVAQRVALVYPGRAAG